MKYLKRINELANTSKEEGILKEKENLIHFLRMNGIKNMDDYSKISDNQKRMFTALLKNKDKEY